MDITSQIKKIWPDWTAEDILGSGSYGKVYKVGRTVAGKTYYSAVKVITIPQNDGEVKAVLAEEGSHSATRAHFKELVDDCIREITIMMDLRGTANVVEVEDFQVVEYEDEIRWDIYIRMEYLTCLTDIITKRRFSEKEAAKLGIDLCSALELCEKKKIIHRDIKPGNIFVSEFGTYKLGDFGIARQMERSSGNLSSRGTFDYMAPEMFRGNGYDATVDLYALGIVLYKLMNRNRAPFLDPEAPKITSGDKEAAFGRRLSGESFPAPCDASDQMSNIILKACRSEPADRFRTPGQMKSQLEKILSGRTDRVMHAAEGTFPERYEDSRTVKERDSYTRENEGRSGSRTDYAGFESNTFSYDKERNREESQTVLYDHGSRDDSDLTDMIYRESDIIPPPLNERPKQSGKTYKNNYKEGRRTVPLIPIICGIAFLAAACCVGFIFMKKPTTVHPAPDSDSGFESRETKPEPSVHPVTLTPSPTPTPNPSPTPTPTPSLTPTPMPSPTPETTPIPTSPPIHDDKPVQTAEPSGKTITIVGGIQAPVEDFVFYFSSQRAITEDELNSMTPSGRADTNIDEMTFDEKQIRLNISQIAIDEIYARHGWTVADSDDPSIADLYARDYLFSLDWYRNANNLYLSGGVSDDDAQLTQIEKDNIEALYWWQHMYWDE